MKKITKIIPLSLLALSLIGCNRTTDTSSYMSSETPITADTSKSSSTKTTTSSSPVSSTSSESSSSSSSSTITDPYKSGWSRTIVDAMLKYLGNQVIPYFNLGKKAEATYVYDAKSASTYPYLQISSEQTWDANLLTTVENLYKSNGYTISVANSVLTAENSETHLTVKLYEDSAFHTPVVEILYDEPYDDAATGSWDNDFTSYFKQKLNNHVLPFVYLGTKNPVLGKEDNTSDTFEIYGYKYNAAGITKANTELTAAGFTTTESVDTKNNKQLVAEYTYDDLTYVKLTISCYQTTTVSRFKMVVLYREAFDKYSFTEWPAEVKQDFSYSLDGHELPLIYIGTNDLSDRTFNASKQTLTINGGFWNDKVIDKAKAVLDADTNSAGSSYWTYTEGSDTNGKTLTAVRENYDDGCGVSFVISGTNSDATKNKIKLVIYFVPRLDIPTTKTDWSDDVKTVFTSTYPNSTMTALDGHEAALPFIYLNTQNETAKFLNSERYRYVQITGGNYNPNIIKNAKTTYKAAGWTVDDSYTYSSKESFKATKQFSHGEGKDPCELTVIINALSSYTGTSSSSFVKMNIYFNEGFNSDEVTDYSSALTKDLNNNFNGLVLPKMYLGTKALYSKYDSNNFVETIAGGKWDDSLFTSVKAALDLDKATGSETSRWTVTEPDMSASTPTLTATMTDEDEGVVTLKFFKYVSSIYPYAVPTINLSYKYNFNEPANGSWSTATKARFEKICGSDYTNNKHIVPYIYLGAGQDKETPSIADKSLATTTATQFKITGGRFNALVYSTADAKLTADGWTVSYGGGSNYRALYAYKKYDDGAYIRINIQPDSSTLTKANIVMNVYYDKPLSSFTTTQKDEFATYSEDTKNKMKDVLNGNVLPYFTLPTISKVTPNATNKDSKNTEVKYFTMTTTVADIGGAIAFNAKETLDNAGWDTKLTGLTFTAGPVVNASKEVDEGKLYLKLYTTDTATAKTKNYRISAFFVPEFSQPASYDYDDNTKSTLNYIVGFDIPSIYLGTDNLTTYLTSSLSSSTYKFAALGIGYSKTLYSDAEAKFNADTTHNWTISYTYENVSGTDSSTTRYCEDKIFTATTTNQYNQSVTVYLYLYRNEPVLDYFTPAGKDFAFTKMEVVVK